MLNKTILLGRLAQDPETFTTQSGILKASFDLAVPVYSKDRQAPPDYIPIVCWRHHAEFARDYLMKGRQIVVEGQLRTRTYTAQDGSKRKAVEVVAEGISFADSGRGNSDAALAGAPASAPAGSSDGFTPVDDDELPF